MLVRLLTSSSDAMDTLTLRTPSPTSQPPPALGLEVSVPTTPAGTARTGWGRRFSQLFAIDFDLDGVELCDGDSLHADLADLFERGDAPTARPSFSASNSSAPPPST